MLVHWKSITLFAFLLLVISSYSYCQTNTEGIAAMRRLDSMRLQMNPSSFFNKFAGTASRGTGSRAVRRLGNNQNAYRIQQGNGSNFVACFDTSGRNSIGQDSMVFYAGQSAVLPDGNILIPGQYVHYSSTDNSSGAYLIKTDTRGNVIWTKFYDSLNSGPNQWMWFYRVMPLQDGSILLGGSANDFASDNSDLLLTKTDASGNIIWTKDYYSRLWTHGSGSADYFYLYQWEQDAQTGDVFINGPTWANGVAVMRMNIANGDIIWSNTYMLNSNGYVYDRCAGILVRQNEIIAFATYASYSTYLLIYRLNKATGDTISTKVLAVTDSPYSRYAFITPEPLKLLNNGNIALSGWLAGYWQYPYNGTDPLYQAGVLILDSNLNFNKAYCFKNNIEINSYNTRVTVHPDGSGVFSMLEVISGYSGRELVTQFNDGVITKQRIRNISNEGYPSEPLYHQMADGGELCVKLVGDSINNSSRLVLSRLHLSDTSSACMGLETNLTSVGAFHYGYNGHVWMDSIKYSIFRERRPRLVTGSVFVMAQPQPVCRQTSFCDSLSLSSEADTLCTNVPVTVHVSKNRECGTMVQFHANNPQVAQVAMVNDSTFQVTFLQAWEGYLHGILPGCEESLDSLYFKVYPNPQPLDLGPTDSICPGNTIVLTAQAGYTSYLWQDGSHAAAYAATAPGTYWVAVTDGCGNHFYDTIQVVAQPGYPLTLGPDRSICQGDRISITATAGFANYQWQPFYNISSTSGQTVQVFPLTDTFYTVKAEKTPGCFSFDTVKVVVHSAPAIYLGSDQQLCSGEAIVADAGPGFNLYTWNDGTPNEQITISSTGQYYVTGVTSDGCRASDTINVVVYPNPQINLGVDGPLCLNAGRLLNAGNGFSSYTWSTGEISSSITVHAVDSYWVNIVDDHNCRGTDTVFVTGLLPYPADFLPFNQTSLCSYGSIDVQPLNEYVRYLWSTGSSTASLNIRKPGTYWLQVTDQNGCVGKDSLQVLEKQCLVGLYVPSAFTPNADQVNDELKALIFGNIRFFEFSVYNRYSELVFKTNDPSKGWDGSVKGMQQQTGNFVWICRYRINNEPEKVEKGNTILVR